MLAIFTRYHGPTDHKGGRISASIYRDGKVWLRTVTPYKHCTDTTENHRLAAQKTLDAYNDRLNRDGTGDWSRAISPDLRSDTPDGRGLVFLCPMADEVAKS